MPIKTRNLLLPLVLIISTTNAFATDADKLASIRSGSIDIYEDPGFIANSLDSIKDDNLYKIQQENSTLKFRVNSPLGDVWGSFDDFEGHFSLKQSGKYNDPSYMIINTRSLGVESDLIAMLLKSKSFFDIDGFPSIRFVGGSFEWYEKDKAVLKGYMTIKNMTRQVAFYVELVDVTESDNNAERVVVNVHTTIKRSEFGLKSLLPMVGDDVNLFLTLVATKWNSPSIAGNSMAWRTGFPGEKATRKSF